MNITQIKLENFTVFKDAEISFDKGINIFIGEMVQERHIS